MSIRYLYNHEINKKAWDQCIASSFNSALYPVSWYLDLVCDRWDALIEDDYSSVMPLIIRQYHQYEIVYTPPFVYELGIFSMTPISASKTQAFLEKVHARFRYYHLILNKYNPIDSKSPGGFHRRYELDLIKPYHKLALDFSPGIRLKLNLATAHGYSLGKNLAPNDLIRFIVLNKIRIDAPLYFENYRLLRVLIAGLIRYQSGELIGVYNQHNELSAVGLLTLMKNRICLLFHVSVPGTENEAFLFLIDRIVEKYAESNVTLVLECPPRSETCRYYPDFAAREGMLPNFKHNGLPFVMRLLSSL
jgi:hypothetical protein